MRYALGVEYDGRPFFGWQTQRQEPTVEAELERALGQVANHSVRVVCAGRTDTGVHARGQVALLDVDPDDLAASAGRSTTSRTRTIRC